MIQLEPGEHLITKARKHWFILFTETVAVILLAIAPLILFEVLSQTSLAEKINLPENNLLELFAYLIWLLASVIIFFVFWTDYYLDIWLVTNQRVIAIEQKGIFSRATVSFRFDKIQDLTVEINGIIPTLLNFGTIHVHTAGQNPDLSLKGAGQPEQVKQAIYQAQTKAGQMPSAGIPT